VLAQVKLGVLGSAAAAFLAFAVAWAVKAGRFARQP
jgi:hypothetical protein